MHLGLHRCVALAAIVIKPPVFRISCAHYASLRRARIGFIAQDYRLQNTACRIVTPLSFEE
jgi:hypothetical protein